MSTRSNVVVITPDNRVHQFYHHCDGYLSGVGEELRSKLVYSLGMSVLVKDMPIYDILVGEITNDDQYEDEDFSNLNYDNRLHADIEFLYIIKDNKLYCINEWSLYEKFRTYQDLIDYICTDENMVPLNKHIDRNQWNLKAKTCY